MGTIGEFKVDFELYNIADVMKQLDAFDKEMQKSEKVMKKNEKQMGKNQEETDAWSKSFKMLKAAGAAAIGTLYAKMVMYSPAIQAHMSIIGVEMQMLGMVMGDAISPVFELLEDFVIMFVDWFYSLDEGTQKMLSYGIALGIVAMALSVLGPWAMAAGVAIGAMGIAYAENLGNMKDNVATLWTSIKEKKWKEAWSNFLQIFKDLWHLWVKPKLISFREKIFEWFDVTSWGELGMKIVNGIWKGIQKTAKVIKEAAGWLLDLLGEALYGEERWEKIKSALKSLAKFIGELAIWVSTGEMIGEGIIEGIKKKLLSYLSFKGELERKSGATNRYIPGYTPEWSGGMGNIPMEQAGGYISHTGMHMMHAGEQVIPSGISSQKGSGQGDIYMTNSMVFYGNMGDKHTMAQNVNDMTQQMKTSLKQFQSTAIGGRF